MSLTYVIEVSNEKNETLGVAKVMHMYNAKGELTGESFDTTAVAMLWQGEWLSAAVLPRNLHALQ